MILSPRLTPITDDVLAMAADAPTPVDRIEQTTAEFADNLPSVVLLSGGQDSVTTLIEARESSNVVECVFVDYGQRHLTPERACAEWWADRYDLPLTVIPVSSLPALGGSALVEDGGDVSAEHDLLPELPASFVPGRNLVLLTLAAARGVRRGASTVYAGMCQTDYSGYPDCRRGTLDELERTLAVGLGAGPVRIATPQMYRTKAETWAAAFVHGELGNVAAHTHTCYEGDRETLWLWGYGCGDCPACELRRAGFREFVNEHPEAGIEYHDRAATPRNGSNDTAPSSPHDLHPDL